MIVSVVPLYDTSKYVSGRLMFVRLVTLLFDQLYVNHWCLVPSPMMGIEVHR